MAPRAASRICSDATLIWSFHAPNIALALLPHNRIPVNTLTRTLAIALLLGTLLLAGGAAMHPILVRHGSMELGMIGGMPIWRTMHLCMLAARD